jgi:hypothetical protein
MLLLKILPLKGGGWSPQATRWGSIFRIAIPTTTPTLIPLTPTLIPLTPTLTLPLLGGGKTTASA